MRGLRTIGLGVALALSAGAGAAHAADSAAGDRIRPWPENPYYWQYKGQPVLLLGGSHEDNLFNHPDGLEEHLDLLKAAGGNYLRNTMSDRNVENRYAFAQRDDGLYDLDQWDAEYWQRFENFLRLCHERDIIVQIEIWDPWDLFASEAPLGFGPTNRGWEVHPFNPIHNVNYTAEESGLAEEITYFSGSTPSNHAFFSTVPALDDNTVVRRYQEAFVNRILDVSLKFPNVLYCMNNEIGEDPEWGRHWARFIRARADAEGVDVYLADMRRNSNFSSGEQVALLHDHEHYDFFEISQNNANDGQVHYNHIQNIRERVRDHPKPLNNVKIYGGHIGSWTTSVEEGVRRFWRNIFAGSATSRFHRPGPSHHFFGLGLSDLAQAHIRSMRVVMDEMGWPDMVPDQTLAELTAQLNLAVRTERTHVAYTRGTDGMARLFINGHEAAGREIGGDLSAWDADLRLALADEFVGDRNWLGVYHHVAAYSRALSESEIAENAAAGAPQSLDGVVVRYAFDEGDGAVVRDRSGQEPALDLRIGDTAAVAWQDDGLSVQGATIIATEGPARRLTEAVRQSGAFSLEAWISPAREVQSGPARIVTLSQDHVTRNFTLGQEEDAYEMRLRTTATSANALPAVQAGAAAEASYAAIRSAEGHRAAIFVTHGGVLKVNMERLNDGLSAQWFQPETAERRTATAEEGGLFSPPSRADWVLLLR